MMFCAPWQLDLARPHGLATKTTSVTITPSAEFMKLHVIIQAVELAKAALLLRHPPPETSSGSPSTQQTSQPDPTLTDVLTRAQGLLEAPLHILGEGEVVTGVATRVRVPARHALAVDIARVELLLAVLEALVELAEEEVLHARRLGGRVDDVVLARVKGLHEQRNGLFSKLEALHHTQR
jgi:hypothetical protein